MNVVRQRSTSAPALLVALSMAICLGAAVDVSASSPQRLRSDRTPTFTAAEREALASLLACLSDTRQQHSTEQQTRPLQYNPTPRRVVDAPRALTVHQSPAVDLIGPGTLVRLHLLNLPPPHAA